MVAAPTGSAAFNIQGETLHRLVEMGIGKKDEELQGKKRDRLLNKFSDLLCLIIDERSLLCVTDMGKAEKRIKSTIHSGLGDPAEIFGGLPVVVLVGDDYQLPARESISQIWKKVMMPKTTANGIKAFMKCAEKVMNLNTSRRLTDTDTDQKELLLKVRLGAMDLTKKEIDKLQSLRLENVKEKFGSQAVECIKQKAVFLSYTNVKKDNRNFEMLKKVASEANPVAIIHPRSTGRRSGKALVFA